MDVQELIKLSMTNMPHYLLMPINQLMIGLIVIKHVVPRKFILLKIVNISKGSNKYGFSKLLTNQYY